MLHGIRLNKNQNRIFEKLTTDLEKILNKTLDEIISEYLLEIIENKKLNPNEKIKRIFFKLGSLRYPKLYSKIERFKKLKAKIIGNNKGIDIIPSNNFEYNEITIKIKVNSYEQLEKLFSDIFSLKKKEFWMELFSFYGN